MGQEAALQHRLHPWALVSPMIRTLTTPPHARPWSRCASNSASASGLPPWSSLRHCTRRRESFTSTSSFTGRAHLATFSSRPVQVSRRGNSQIWRAASKMRSCEHSGVGLAEMVLGSTDLVNFEEFGDSLRFVWSATLSVVEPSLLLLPTHSSRQHRGSTAPPHLGIAGLEKGALSRLSWCAIEHP